MDFLHPPLISTRTILLFFCIRVLPVLPSRSLFWYTVYIIFSPTISSQMSSLRRRVFGGTPDTPPEKELQQPQDDSRERELSPDREPADPQAPISSIGENLRIVSAQKLEKLRYHQRDGPKKGQKRRKAGLFTLGGMFGVAAAAYFAGGGNDMIVDLAGMMDINMDSVLERLPAGLISDARELQRKEKDTVNYDSFMIGLHAKSQGIKATHPVIMIPGVISTGLESWATEDQDSRTYFRKRLWGSWSMMRALVLDKAEWKRKIMLDKETGLDPPGVKLRAAQGFDATDFFITGYWIWNKILENLASLGYDPGNALTAAYDWRLAYMDLERRDAYFTRLKAHIELAVRLSGKKVVLLSHSMGSQVLFYFFHWVEAEGYGNGGGAWVDAFVGSWINVSGCMLGAIKGVPAVLSGEMKDTAHLNSFAVYGLEKFLSRHERAEIFRAMPGISSMLPMGGEAVWGNLTWAPDDLPGQETSFGNMLSFDGVQGESEPKLPITPPDLAPHAASVSDNKLTKDTDPPITSSPPLDADLTVENALSFLFNNTETWYSRKTKASYSHGVARTRAEIEYNTQKNPQKWVNPLESRLPNAPNLKIYCFYGVGKPTERAYYYRQDSPPIIPGNTTDPTDPVNFYTINTAYSAAGPPGNASGNGSSAAEETLPDSHERTTERGVVMGEGDGTVNLLSLGYMCNHGWRMKKYNPGGAKVTVYEMPHEPDRFSPRGGPNTGDHVDILGRSSLNDLILRVAGGKGDLIEENVQSNIKEYSKRVKVYDDE